MESKQHFGLFKMFVRGPKTSLPTVRNCSSQKLTTNGAELPNMAQSCQIGPITSQKRAHSCQRGHNFHKDSLNCLRGPITAKVGTKDYQKSQKLQYGPKLPKGPKTDKENRICPKMSKTAKQDIKTAQEGKQLSKGPKSGSNLLKESPCKTHYNRTKTCAKIQIPPTKCLQLKRSFC